MKVRILSSAVGLIILFAVLAMFDTVVLNVAIALICLMAVYELLSATGCVQNRAVAALSMLFCAVIPFAPLLPIARNIPAICYAYCVALFTVLLRHHDRLRIEQLAMSFLFSLVIPFSLSTVIYIRDRLGVSLGVFYVMLTLGGAWLSDTGAYFSGRLFGRHKLAPVISPKKTVEGAIGGAVFAEAAMLLVAWLCQLAAARFWQPIAVNYPLLLCVVPVLSGISIVGDLSASIIKRQFGVKDYGSIMPGHGGIMDRFDSALMVAPLVYLLSRWLPLATLL